MNKSFLVMLLTACTCTALLFTSSKKDEVTEANLTAGLTKQAEGIAARAENLFDENYHKH